VIVNHQYSRQVRGAVVALALISANIAVARAANPDAPPAEAAPPAKATAQQPADRTAAYRDLVRQEAVRFGIPPDLADAVASIESNYDPGAMGAAGEIGLMQVMPATAAMLGFRGTNAELAVPAVNVSLGVRYLSRAWQLAGTDLCRALMKYRAGHGEEQMSPLSVEYCRRAKLHLARKGSPLVDGLPIDTAAAPAVAGAVPRLAGRRPVARPAADGSRAFWARHEQRVARIRATVRAKWARLARN
jgi:soluble lytic murein transglycosylase-like protein